MRSIRLHMKNRITIPFIIRQLRDKGIIYCFKAGIRRYIYPIVERMIWIVPAFRFLLKSNTQPEKRILAIWDFHTVPYSIGDLIILHEKIQILRFIHRVDKADICFICEPQRPVRKLGEQGVTPENFHYHFPSMVSTVYSNPHVGSFFIFDSHRQFEDFVAGNINGYYIWPEFKKYSVRHRTYESNFNSIQDFYRENGFLPYLDCRPSTLEWAYSFYKKNISPEFPVVVHMRNNPYNSAARNAQIDVWLHFFKNCEGKFNVKFVIIGAAGEIDERFRCLSNVLIAKDYHTTVEQDMVLVYSALIHLGTSSGPSAMAVFSRTPYISFGYRPANESLSYGDSFNFATDLQKLIWEPETKDMLMEEFSNLFCKVDKAYWEEQMESFMSARSKETFRSDLLWT